MKSDNQAQSSKQRLVTFLNNVCPQKIAENDNDNPIEKSRWAKWQFIKSGTGNKLEFHQLKKSESKIINRLLDRLDPSAGKACCQDRNHRTFGEKRDRDYGRHQEISARQSKAWEHQRAGRKHSSSEFRKSTKAISRY